KKLRALVSGQIIDVPHASDEKNTTAQDEPGQPRTRKSKNTRAAAVLRSSTCADQPPHHFIEPIGTRKGTKNFAQRTRIGRTFVHSDLTFQRINNVTEQVTELHKLYPHGRL